MTKQTWMGIPRQTGPRREKEGNKKKVRRWTEIEIEGRKKGPGKEERGPPLARWVVERTKAVVVM